MIAGAMGGVYWSNIVLWRERFRSFFVEEESKYWEERKRAKS
jgi:hypothetical protein